MPIRYFVKQLLLPPGILLLLLVLAWWLRSTRPRLAAVLFALGVGGLWLMSLPVVVQWGARAIEREPALAPSEWAALAGRADAIVVLGSGRERGDPAWGSDQPTAMGLERQRYAARLAKASGLPVLTTGGLHYGTPPSEAQMMADSLRDDFGVVALACQLDDGGLQALCNTLTAMVRVNKHASQPGGKVHPVMIVTWPQAGHAQRALVLNHQQGGVVFARLRALGEALTRAFQRTAALRTPLAKGPCGTNVAELRALGQ